MSAELISLKNPRRLVMAVLLLVLLGIAVPLAAGITAPEVTYPGSPEESIQLDNGDTVTLEGGKQVEIIGSGVPDTPIGHTCEVSGDVAGERRDLYPNFETGSTGDYTITSAGHPPALHWHLGQRGWSVDNARGMALGVIDEADFTPSRGRLRPGEALMFYTDGVIESADKDLDAGIALYEFARRRPS